MRLKKVKGASEKLDNSPYVINNPMDYKGKYNKLFENNNSIEIEIGTGKGDFIIEKAVKNPNINFIGIEKQDSVLVKILDKLESLPNLKLIRIDARLINEIFYKEIDKIYLNFSDPWPKSKHEKRRLTSNVFLEKYDNLFKKDKIIEMKTDNKDLFVYSLETLVNNGYNIIEKSYNIYENIEEGNIATEYEKRFVAMGKPIYKVKVFKR